MIQAAVQEQKAGVIAEVAAVAEVIVGVEARANLLNPNLHAAQDLVRGPCLLAHALAQNHELSQDRRQGPDLRYQLARNVLVKAPKSAFLGARARVQAEAEAGARVYPDEI